jgi:glycosyltransferase involved in cell wall biosynthesis
MKKLYLICNEKIFYNKKNHFCENKDIQSIINFLSLKLKSQLQVIARYSKSAQPFKLKKFSNFYIFRAIKILSFFSIFFSILEKKRILIISITPFSFALFLIFKFFFNCKFFIYLRSDGHKEYEKILGKNYVRIYEFMFKYITQYSDVISCNRQLFKKKSHILYPSELSINWQKKIKKNIFKNNIIKILYVGRFKIEKGVYSLLDILNKLPNYIKLVLVGTGDLLKFKNDRVEIIDFVKNEKKLISMYDSTNIFILPSYTEGHPKVIDEALSRMRPVIVFNDIKHVIQNRHGIFSVRRSSRQLLQTINYIKDNNKLISKQLILNKLPQKKEFLRQLYKIIS